MEYTQEDFEAATVITHDQYVELKNPIFEGQTRVDSNGEYRVYVSCDEGKLYCIINKL